MDLEIFILTNDEEKQVFEEKVEKMRNEFFVKIKAQK